MIENLQDELYQLENKQTKTFLTMPQNFLQSTWKIEYAKSNNIGVTSTDDINQSILAALRTFSNLKKKKKKMKLSTPRRQLPKLQLLNFLAKFLTERKYLMTIWWKHL